MSVAVMAFVQEPMWKASSRVTLIFVPAFRTPTAPSAARRPSRITPAASAGSLCLARIGSSSASRGAGATGAAGAAGARSRAQPAPAAMASVRTANLVRWLMVVGGSTRGAPAGGMHEYRPFGGGATVSCSQLPVAGRVSAQGTGTGHRERASQ